MNDYWQLLLHAHDHVWRSDWPLAFRVKVCREMIRAMNLLHIYQAEKISP